MSEQTKIGGLTREEHVELVRSALPAACFYAFDSLLASAFRLAEVERETIERAANVACRHCSAGDERVKGNTLGRWYLKDDSEYHVIGSTEYNCGGQAIRSLPLTTGEVE